MTSRARIIFLDDRMVLTCLNAAHCNCWEGMLRWTKELGTYCGRDGTYWTELANGFLSNQPEDKLALQQAFGFDQAGLSLGLQAHALNGTETQRDEKESVQPWHSQKVRPCSDCFSKKGAFTDSMVLDSGQFIVFQQLEGLLQCTRHSGSPTTPLSKSSWR